MTPVFLCFRGYMVFLRRQKDGLDDLLYLFLFIWILSGRLSMLSFIRYGWQLVCFVTIMRVVHGRTLL